MKITIETIEHSAQRYDTCGDWQWVKEGSELNIKVSKLHLKTQSAAVLLIGVHELVEALLCYREGIGDDEVDAFDMSWLPHDGLTEPGDDPAAPYHKQHLFASNIERLIAARLDINWQQYEAEIEKLG